MPAQYKNASLTELTSIQMNQSNKKDLARPILRLYPVFDKTYRKYMDESEYAMTKIMGVQSPKMDKVAPTVSHSVDIDRTYDLIEKYERATKVYKPCLQFLQWADAVIFNAGDYSIPLCLHYMCGESLSYLTEFFNKSSQSQYTAELSNALDKALDEKLITYYNVKLVGHIHTIREVIRFEQQG